MSLRVQILATRQISFKRKDGTIGYGVQTEELRVLPTPHRATADIVSSNDPIEAYRRYVRSMSVPYLEPVYADDDVKCKNLPIRERVVDWGGAHLRYVDDWLYNMDREGYTISVGMV